MGIDLIPVADLTGDELQCDGARWNLRSVAMIVLAWLVLQIGCLFTPGLLDDVDSIYIEVAREMLVRHDYVTPYVDGVRFFDKPPLMYWLAAGSMRVFGAYDWAARLPLAVLTLGLFLAVYGLGLRLFGGERAGLYSALAMATCVGPFLYTRFFIPDILICLWMTLGVHAFLVAVERIRIGRSALWPCLGFAAVTALNLLTKGLIGLVFPVGFVALYLGFTRQWRLLGKIHLVASVAVFLAIAGPWHVMAALRNPAIDLPAGVGLPARGGWAWFYLYNEHVARFLSRRIPHDYGQVPVVLFWVLAGVWLFPWTAFLVGAVRACVSKSRMYSHVSSDEAAADMGHPASLALLVWAGIVLGFFTFSARQEYYSLPAIPALALMAGGWLAQADAGDRNAALSARRWHLWMLVPVGTLAAAVALFFAVTSPHAEAGTDIATLLATGGDYNLSLSHLFDLTGRAMGLFRGPLVLFGLSMAAIGPGTYWLRRAGRTYAANLALAGAGVGLLLAVHAGLVRFYPTLGSKELALAIVQAQDARPEVGDLIAIDGELTAGSTLLFYTRQTVHLVNGRVNGPWYGSFWPDAPVIFETDDSLRARWAGVGRVFLLTYHPAERMADLGRFGGVRVVAEGGGKSVLTNR